MINVVQHLWHAGCRVTSDSGTDGVELATLASCLSDHRELFCQYSAGGQVTGETRSTVSVGNRRRKVCSTRGVRQSVPKGGERGAQRHMLGSSFTQNNSSRKKRMPRTTEQLRKGRPAEAGRAGQPPTSRVDSRPACDQASVTPSPLSHLPHHPPLRQLYFLVVSTLFGYFQ